MQGKATWKAVLLGVILGMIPWNVQAASLNEIEEVTEKTTEAVTEPETEKEPETETETETETESEDGEPDGSTSQQETGTIESAETRVLIIWPLEERANKGYVIYVRKGKSYVKVGKTKKGVNVFELTRIKGEALKPSTTYTIKVVALRGSGSRTKKIRQWIIRTATTPKTPVWVKTRRVSGKKALLKWKKVKDISGYELQVSRYKKKGYKTVDLIKPSKVKYSLKDLKKGRKYYVRIRTYKVVTGGRVYSPWSKVKKI